MSRIFLPTLILFFIQASILFAQTQIGNDIDGEAFADGSGNAVSINNDGTIVAIGASMNDPFNQGDNSGHVRIFQFTNGNWNQMGSDIDADVFQEALGSSVRLNAAGNRVVIGSPFSILSASEAGEVNVFEFSGGDWNQVGTSVFGENAFDRVGNTIDFNDDGNRFILSSDFSSPSGRGYAKIYQQAGNNWSQVGSTLIGEENNDRFGSSVSMSANGNIVAVGAPQNDANGTLGGHVQVFEFTNGNWSQLGADIDAASNIERMGTSIALNGDGNRIVIGAPDDFTNGDDIGRVQVFELSNGNWTQLGQTLEAIEENNWFGYSVDMNHSGDIIVVGAPRGSNSSFDGKVRAFQLINGTWTQIGDSVLGEVIANANSSGFFGASVATNFDGTLFVAGDPSNDGSDIDAGHARVFDLNPALASQQSNSPTSMIFAPNPTSNYIDITSTREVFSEEVGIFDAKGMRLKTVDFTSSSRNTMRLNMESFTPGMYIIQITTESGIVNKKVVKR